MSKRRARRTSASSERALIPQGNAVVAPPEDVAFAMSMFAYASIGPLLPGAEARAREGIEKALASAAPTIGRHELVWGPCIVNLHIAVSAVNTMFVARSLDRPGEQVIAISGTNPTSFFDWLVEDLFVSRQIPWPYAKDRSPGAAIAQGTAIGLSVLQDMKPSGDRPGAGTTLEQHLTATASPGAKILVTGHSLGGALSAVVAQWLADTQGLPGKWDPERLATVSVVSFAGPSPGNAAFAAHCAATFGPNLRRCANALDVVTHAWPPDRLKAIPGLYEPTIRAPKGIVALASVAKWLARGAEYVHVDAGAAPLPGAVRTDILKKIKGPLLQFLVQMIYQHLGAYYPFFHFDDGWAPWLKILKMPEVPRLFERALHVPASVTRGGGAPAPPRKRKVRVGRKTVTVPAHPDDAQAKALADEISRSLARHA